MNEGLGKVRAHPFIAASVKYLESVLGDAGGKDVVGELVVSDAAGGIRLENWFLVADVIELFYEFYDILLYFDIFQLLLGEVEMEGRLLVAKI